MTNTVSHTTPSRPGPYRTELLPATAVHYADTDRLAARIAANQIDQIEQLSLIGCPTSFDQQTRDVVETALRLAARRVLES